MIKTSSVPSWKSSVIFGKCPKNVWKRSPYLRKNFGTSSEIFGNRSEIFGKSSKTSSLVCLCNKQNVTCLLVDMNFIFECSTRYLTSERSSLVRYRGHVTSYITRVKFEEYSQLSATNRHLKVDCSTYRHYFQFPFLPPSQTLYLHISVSGSSLVQCKLIRTLLKMKT